jgi:hypothetical protein
MKQLLTIFTLLLFCSLGCAAEEEKNNMTTCPAPDELRMDGQQHWWATKIVHDVTSDNPGTLLKYKWYSTSPSLAKGIDRFAGAQYLGSSEGHIVCYYKPAVTFDTQDFPIFIYFENLVFRPKGNEWQQDRKNEGVINCINNDPSLCAYLIYQPHIIKDPYESLRELK